MGCLYSFFRKFSIDKFNFISFVYFYEEQRKQRIIIITFALWCQDVIYCYDAAIIQWITSCHKSYDHTGNNTLARRRNVIDNVCAKNAFSYWNNW